MKEKEEEKIPLKTILTNFLNHVETLEVKREEGEDLYEKEFQCLKQFSDELKGKEEFTVAEGDKEVNRKKNRYKDILPFNYTRVLLSEYPGVPGSDYINANYIKGASGSNAYIASQGPLPHTVNDWWRMVVECEVQVIVMACNEQEAGKHKCECYWTPDLDGPRQYGKFSVTLLKCRDICPDFLVRTMRLIWTGESGQEEERTVCQFHYSAWPDHGIPTQVKPLLEMVRLIRDCQASETLPVLIHCSAGCGRTGTICVIDFVWGLLRTGKLSSEFSLYELVKDMRRQRIAMVQTVDQYMLCHRAVKQLFLEQLRVIDSHPYENVGCDGRPLATDIDSVTPDYETIFIKGQGDVDIDRVLARSTLPRMGVGMLGQRETPTREHHNGEGSEGSEQSLPATLEEFQTTKPPPLEPSKPTAPTIHEPPASTSTSVPAPQRFKKGNLRLLQGEDGGWKLEELELEKRRSLDGARNESFEKREEGASPRSGEKPPQAEAKSRKKKSSREEKGEASGPSLMRKPSMKKLKAFFDKDRNKENKSEKDEKGDADYAIAVSKLPSLEAGVDVGLLPGSKSVPSSLDRKQRYREAESSGLGSLDTRGSGGTARYWPLGRQTSTDGLQGERPALPVKRSKSMKAITPGNQQLGTEPSFGREDFRDSAEPSSPYDTYPKAKPRSEELIDLTKRQVMDPKDPFEGRTRFDFDPHHILQQSGSEGEEGRGTYHFGDGQGKPGSLTAPPKPKRDWSSLSHDYANMAVCGGGRPVEVAEQERRAGQQAERDHIRTQLQNFVTVKMRKEGAGGISHVRQGSGDSLPHHPRQSSADSTGKNSDFLDTQMAKLMERKGHSRDETDSVSQHLQQPDMASMRRSKSGDIPRPPTTRPQSGDLSRPEALVLVRSVSGDLAGHSGRNPEILDEDARKMLKDCQEYLMGAFDQAEAEGLRVAQSTEGSPRESIGRSARSLHSSPGNSYSKYSGSSGHLNRSHSGQLNLSPAGTIQKAVSSPTSTAQRSYSGVAPKCDASPREDRASLHSEASEGSKHSPHTETGPSSLEDAGAPEYQNVDRRVEAQARGKLREATNVRNRERRNSFRQAVDTRQLAESKVPQQPQQQQLDQFGRPYEPIWFPPGQEEEQTSPRASNGTANIDTRLLADGPVYANASPLPEGRERRKVSAESSGGGLDPRQLRKSDASLRSSHSGHIRSGSYDNIPTPGPQAAAQFSPDPPSSYEAIVFQGRRSAEGEPGLQSVGLVAEACRDYERREPVRPEARPPVTRQNSGGRLPPPYQSPPGPPPPYQPPPLSVPSPQRVGKMASPQHSNMMGRTFAEAGPQEPMTSTPKRPQQPGPRYPAPPPYPLGVRPEPSVRPPGQPGPRHPAHGRGSRDDSHVSLQPRGREESRRARQMRRNSSLVTTSRGEWTGPVVVGPLPRTAVLVGAGSTPPGVDLDRIAASISSAPATIPNPAPGPPSRQFGGRIAERLSGAAQNLKSRIAGISAAPAPRAESSPPERVRPGVREVPIRVEGEGREGPPALPATLPGGDHRDYGYPIRLDKRPLGPRETPAFTKKQEYL